MNTKYNITRCYLEITNVCNLNCVFCPKTTRKKHMMTQEELTHWPPISPVRSSFFISISWANRFYIHNCHSLYTRRATKASYQWLPPTELSFHNALTCWMPYPTNCKFHSIRTKETTQTILNSTSTKSWHLPKRLPAEDVLLFYVYGTKVAIIRWTFSLSQMSRTELVQVMPWRENVLLCVAQPDRYSCRWNHCALLSGPWWKSQFGQSIWAKSRPHSFIATCPRHLSRIHQPHGSGAPLPTLRLRCYRQTIQEISHRGSLIPNLLSPIKKRLSRLSYSRTLFIIFQDSRTLFII